MGAAGSGGAGLNVEDVFSTYLYTGDYNTGTLNQHIKNNVPLSNFGTGGTSVNFDGGDYLTRADFTSNADGKTLTFSAWILFNDFEDNFVFSSDPSGGGAGVNVGYRTGKLRFEAYNSGGSIVSQWHVDDTNTPFHQWFHLCFSVNTASGTSATKVYINDVAATTESLSNSNQDIDFTRTVQRLAARTTDYKLTGNLAHVFMDYTYRNLDTESNRRLFIDANGGSTDPSTLSALNPIMYCPLTNDYTMGKNLGTGGDFTSSGDPAFSTLGTKATADTSEGGMVWIKNRSSTDSHMLFDTERGAPKSLSSNENTDQVTNNPDTLTQFLADGFFLGDDVAVNTNSEDYASWTWRKTPKFFDVVTYTGNGSAQSISHSLGSVPGMVVVKNTDSPEDWWVYHRGVGNTKYLELNQTSSTQTSTTAWNDTTPTGTHFTVGSGNPVNENNKPYVAYLFAHNDGDGEFGPDGDADIIKCGNYTGNGSTDGPEIDLGFEPQWVMLKRTDSAADWVMQDVMRGMIMDSGGAYIKANDSAAEFSTTGYIQPEPTGFKVRGTGSSQANASGGNYIYIAIRRGTAVPTSATEVFEPIEWSYSSNGEYTLSNLDYMDMFWHKQTSGSQDHMRYDRLRGTTTRFRTDNAQEISDTNSWDTLWDNMNKFKSVSSAGGEWQGDQIGFAWKRAPNYMDVVAYSGDSTSSPNSRNINHNLGVAPEMMWIKCRTANENWAVYHSGTGETKYLNLNNTNAAATSANWWRNTAPTDTVFTIGHQDDVNLNGGTHIAYLFATLAGISKVGSVTHSGTTNVDCGFSSGSRFVLLKRTDATGDWYVWNSTRGIVSGNDPYILLNTTAAEVTNTDYIDPLSSGFTISDDFTDGDYLFYAIA